MAVDTKAQAICDAAQEVKSVAKRFIALSSGVLKPVAGDVEPHADTIAAIKVKVVALYDEWDIVKVAMDDAKNA